MEEINNNVEIESEQKQKKKRKKKEKTKEKKDWKGNPGVKVLLYFLFFLLTIATAVTGGVIVYFAKNQVFNYPHDKDYVIYLAQEQVLEENSAMLEEAFRDYLISNNLGITTTNLYKYGDEMLEYLEQVFEERVNDPFYRFSIRFFPDTDLEMVLYGDKYTPHAVTGDSFLMRWDSYCSYEWIESYTENYTFDTYRSAMDYQYELEEKSARDTTIEWQTIELVLPKDANIDEGYYPATVGGYQLNVDYEKKCSTEFCIYGELTEYETIDNNGWGHNLKWELYCIGRMYEMRKGLQAIMVALCVALFLCFIFLMVSAGHVRDSKEIRESWFEKIPLEVILAMIGVLILGANLLRHDVNRFVYEESINIGFNRLYAYFAGYMICLLLLGLFCSRTLVVRKKANRIIDSSLICRFCKKHLGMESTFMVLQKYVGSKIPFMWKAIMLYIFITLIEFMSLTLGKFGMPIFLLIKICITAFVIVMITWLHELKKGGEELVAGNTKHKVNTRFMKWAFKEHGDNLNNLNEGLQVAVEERLKSERMKTELITNVSHDIKTPLTSIINYVDLLQKQNITSEPEASYIEVLARQSDRLKKLIDDLVEASKASSGNITVEMKVMDANLVLAQATAEYVDKLAEKNIRLVLPETSEPALINADGRHLWRVIDNLLSNAYKYAMPGTRVYANIETVDDRVQITFKNISKDQLNVSSDELMERFVRGDSSRNTEGSGLGLSIAKSLCQLMEADFDIEIDGDLYKAIITFDRVSEEEKMYDLTEQDS